MSKHTPGPWIWEAGYHEDPGHYSGLHCGIDPDRYVVRSCDGCAIIKNESDARLIAAAPEMLEALRYASQLLEDAGVPTLCRQPIWDAKKKAEGK